REAGDARNWSTLVKDGDGPGGRDLGADGGQIDQPYGEASLRRGREDAFGNGAFVRVAGHPDERHRRRTYRWAPDARCSARRRIVCATSTPLAAVIPAKPAHASTSSARIVPCSSSIRSTPP